MKRLINLLLTILIGLFYACSPDQKETPKTYLSGKYFPANDSVTIYLRLSSDEIDYGYPIYLDSTMTNDSGEFSMNLAISKPMEISLSSAYESRIIFIEPGDSIYLESDNDYRSPLIGASGKGSEKLLLLDRIDTLLGLLQMREYDSVNVHDQYLKRIQEYKEIVKTAKSSYTPAFNQYLETSLLQDHEYFVTNFHRYMQMFDVHLPFDTALSDRLKAEMLNLSKTEIGHADFKRSIYNSVLRKAHHDTLSTQEQLKIFHDEVVKLGLSDSTTNQYLARGYLRYLSKGEVAAVEPYLFDYQKSNPDSRYTATLNKEYNAWKTIAKGEFAPNFTATYADSTAFQLSDLLGKVVYIDVWATWCKPCLEEVEPADKIRQHFQDQDELVFVNVSVDGRRKTWEDHLLEHPEEGVINVNDPGNFKSQIAKSYKIDGIPRYIIIDKEGKIFSIDAQRPSSGDKLIDQLNDALALKVGKL